MILIRGEPQAGEPQEGEHAENCPGSHALVMGKRGVLRHTC